MFDPRSRYAQVADAEITVVTADGEPRTIRFKRRRFPPAPEAQTVVAQHRVKQGDRLDNLTAVYLGDPTQFWRLCDANLVFAPSELTETLGRYIRIAIPTV
jgi:hypothetical protein